MRLNTGLRATIASLGSAHERAGRLRDARDFARHAQDNAHGPSANALAVAVQPQHAALFDLVVIGETLNRVSAAVKSAALTLEWRLIDDLRNLVGHAYWQIDLEIIADV
jgi:uncharacterized protein with HEPN domain